MRKLFFLLFICISALACAKSAKIPTYRSFILWVQAEDTVYVDNSTLLFESPSPDGTVVIRVRHEDWNPGVSAKSSSRLASWHSVISQRRGIRAIVHQNGSNVDGLMHIRNVPGTMQNVSRILTLSTMTHDWDMDYDSEYMVENTGDQEIVVNDLNRGLVWYVPAKSYLLLNMGRLPQACFLRIANTDPNHPEVKYVTIGSASFAVKMTVAYEDENCWIYLLSEESQVNNILDLKFNRMVGASDDVLRTLYIRRDKDTFQEIPMPEKEVFAIIKEAKQARKHKKSESGK